MRSHMMRGLVVAVAVLAWGAGARAAGEKVATVNGTPITFDGLVEELLVRHGESVLEDMIRELVVNQAVAGKGIKVSEDEVDVEIERERRALAVKGKKLEDMVGSKYQMSMTGYRSIVRRWLLIRKLILGTENPREAEVMVWFYENRARRYDTPAEYTVRHIFIAYKDPRTGRERTQAEVQGRVEAARNGVLRGQSFAALAARYSDDLITHDEKGRRITPRPRVELGTLNERAARVHLEPSFVEAMVRLKPGQSGMVDTPQGYHFIQVTGKKEGREARWEDFRKIARSDYLEERALLRREAFLRDLMERARIERNFTPPKRGEGARGRPPERDADGSWWDETEEKP
ncbi:MAG: peptidylprolyl isomerase [Planctomycetota bacterium]